MYEGPAVAFKPQGPEGPWSGPVHPLAIRPWYLRSDQIGWQQFQWTLQLVKAAADYAADVAICAYIIIYFD